MEEALEVGEQKKDADQHIHGTVYEDFQGLYELLGCVLVWEKKQIVSEEQL